MFELAKTQGFARLGRLKTKHGTVETPTLLPVINPNISTLSASEMQERFGVQMVITNSYIIWKNPALRKKALENGLHELLETDMPIMTDSGTFQSYVYGDVDVSPEEIVAFQRDIGSDVGTVLDIFSKPDESREKVSEAWTETFERTKRGAEIRGDMILSGVVQGGVFPDLRERCARQMHDIDVGVHPIGGVVPLMESYRYEELAEVIMGAKKGLHPGRPVHLFGAGHPMLFGLATYLGCDLFDSSSYVKFARDGRMMFPDGTYKLADMEEIPCDCPACLGHDAKSLMDSPDKEKKLAMHNLYACFSELKRVREALRRGELWNLVEKRAVSHPEMWGVLQAIANNTEFLAEREPLWKDGAFQHTCPASSMDPFVRMVRTRIEDMAENAGPQEGRCAVLKFRKEREPERDLLLAEALLKKGYGEVFIQSYFGLIPFGLCATYPFGQSILPSRFGPETMGELENMWNEGACRASEPLALVDEKTVSGDALLPSNRPEKKTLVKMIRQICDYQFYPGAWEKLLAGKIEIVTSKTTGKVRNVMCDGDHVLSLRARSGLFTLKLAGGKRILERNGAERMRVVVDDDSAEFNRKGKSVFAKFVLAYDKGIRNGDEVIVVDRENNIAAVGRMLMNPRDVPYFNGGVAVKVREGAN